MRVRRRQCGGLTAPQCASSQLCAARASTASGTESDSAGMRRLLHHLLDHRQRLLDLVLRHLEHQFVVHLQQHLRVELLLRERGVHADHGAADDVGGGALQPRVDRGALVEGADRGVGVRDVGVVALAAEQREHVAVLLGERLGLVHVVADAGEALEIFLDVGAGLLARDAELVGEPERRDAVDDAEVDRLGAAAHLARHALHRHAEHLRRGHGVDVEAVAEGLLQRLDVGDLGEQPQLDLRIVGGDELVARRRDEGAADLAAFLGADRDVLQVRLGGREPAGRRRGQRVARVHAVGRAD